MKIGGFQKFSLIDYPAKSSAVIFTLGCNFRCLYCHNPELVLPEFYAQELSFTEIMQFLCRRTGQLDGVVITGGEPTIHVDLPSCAQELKGRGYAVKLDTNGSNPAMIADLLAAHLLDYIAMDIKAPVEKYPQVANAPVQAAMILQSIRTIIDSGIEHQFRTTRDPALLNADDIRVMQEMIGRHESLQIQACTNPRRRLDSIAVPPA